MAKTRNWQPGDITVHLLPFPRANSRQHVNSLVGRQATVDVGDGPYVHRYDTGKMWMNLPHEGPLKFSDDDVVCADDGHLQAKLGTLQNPHDVLYINGHCCAGSSRLTSSDKTVSKTEDKIVDLLDGCLPSDFPGIIKVYACQSALDWGLFWQSFAQRFTNEMWERGYRSCSFYGYKSSVSTYRGLVDPFFKRHKGEIDEEGKVTGKRASATRVEIIPINLYVSERLKKALGTQTVQGKTIKV